MSPAISRFAAGPFQFHVLAHGELQLATETGLDSRLVNLAIALRGMTVAGLKERTGNMNRNVERSASHQFLVVKIACMNVGRITADAAPRWRRR